MLPLRYWLLTWTCYGQWLPGERRGFVGNVRDRDARQVIHNIPGTPYDEDMPALKAWVLQQMKGDPVILAKREADAMILQYQETARIRKWSLEAASVMFNHTHLVVGVPGNPDPERILETFKSWATRAVTKIRPLPPNGALWTVKGSKRKLANETALRDAVVYVARKQSDPLAIWVAPPWEAVLDAFDTAQVGKLGTSRHPASRDPASRDP